jgi:hypothetical protein
VISLQCVSYLLGASMRMGAEMPRYNLEKLQRVNRPALLRGACSGIPLMLDDLSEAVYHAIVCLVSGGLAGLQLSGRVQIQLSTVVVHVLHASLDDVQRIPVSVSGGFSAEHVGVAIHNQNLRAHAGLALYAVMTCALEGATDL